MATKLFQNFRNKAVAAARGSVAVCPFRVLSIIALMSAMVVPLSQSFAQIASPATYETFRQQTIDQVRLRTEPLLTKYCKGACEVLKVSVEVMEELPETEDLGFEGVTTSADLRPDLYASRLNIELQIDDRVTTVNRGRLRSIILNKIKDLAISTDVVWNPVRLPEIGQSAAQEEDLKEVMRRKVARVMQGVIDKYCPNDCLLSHVTVEGRLISPDEADSLPPKQVVRSNNDLATILRLDEVGAEVSFNQDLAAERRERILSIMAAKTRFVDNFDLQTMITLFPETYSEQERRKSAESEDPFGLERLRQMLELFRELAGTKEIITTKESNSVAQSNTEASLRSELQSNSQLQSSSSSELKNSESLKESETNENHNNSQDPLTYALYFGGFLLLSGLIIALIMRFASANRDARVMMAAAEPAPHHAGQSGQIREIQGAEGPGTSGNERRNQELSQRFRCEALKDELIRVFMDQPKVAKETFSRLLREEGVEETAKYVHILGQLVIFELLDDPTMQRELYSLSEYYHKSSFRFSNEEEHALLLTLKTKVTASEMKVMTRKRMAKFDFLASLDANQVYNLIADEKPTVQSIVLTQLDHKRRQDLFDLYEGQKRVLLLQELCRADAIPKEFLANVATALQKKVTSRPEFDTENLRSNDILLDLLEKSSMDDQRALMGNLQRTNPDAARAIKIKLVTIEMLPYLKDGHLLELILGIERADLLTFLMGAAEHIRNLLLSKAPRELAESWVEDLEAMAGVDATQYRLTEMKIVGRVRALANTGAINLLDINNLIFSVQDVDTSPDHGHDYHLDLKPDNMVA